MAHSISFPANLSERVSPAAETAGLPFTTFAVPGQWTDAGQAVVVFNNNLAGAVSGSYFDANSGPNYGGLHGFVRTPSGTFTTFDAPLADTTIFGTNQVGVNPAVTDAICYGQQ
jgi:hypothetical protein